jgi:very-short-patch-repair endonuclease
MAITALERARELRVSSTDAERKLWGYLRGRQLDGLKFRRQHPIPPYTVDFFCSSAKLIVEREGSQHTEESDRVRTSYLQSKGFSVLRFWNNEVLTQTEAVVEAIFNTASASPLTPNPLPVGERL